MFFKTIPVALYRFALVAALTETSPSGICTIRRWCGSSRATRTALRASTWALTELGCGLVDWTTRCDRGICVRGASWPSTTLPRKYFHWDIVRPEIGWPSDWRVQLSRYKQNRFYSFTDCWPSNTIAVWSIGAAHVKAGQVSTALARIVCSFVEIRRYRQVVCVDWKR